MIKKNIILLLTLATLLLSFAVSTPVTVAAAASTHTGLYIPPPPGAESGLHPGPEGSLPGDPPANRRPNGARPNIPPAPLEGKQGKAPSLENPVSIQNMGSMNVTPKSPAVPTWGDNPTRITTLDYNSYFVNPQVVLDHLGVSHVIYASQSGPNLDQPSIYYINNQGGHWSQPIMISGDAHSKWPRLAIGPDDHLHVLIPDGYGKKVYYIEGIAGVWSAPVVLGSLTSPGPGQGDIAVDDGNNLHVIFWQGMLGDTASPIEFYRCRTSAGAWGPSVELPQYIAKALDLRVAATGGVSGQAATVHIAFSSDNGSNYQKDYETYYYSISTRPGTSAYTVASGPYNMSNSPGILSYDVSLAVDHLDHTVHLEWSENLPGAYNSSVMYMRSLNGGANWSAGVSISGSSLNSTWQIETDIYARNGSVYFAWNCNWGASFTRSFTTVTGGWSNITSSMGDYREVLFTPTIAVDDYGKLSSTFQLGRDEASGIGQGIWSNQGTTGVQVKTYSWPSYDANTTNGADWVLVTNTTNQIAPFIVQQAGRTIYYNILPAGGRQTPTFPGVVGGPITVISLSGVPLTASQRTLTNASFEETPAVSDSLASSDYLFTWYDSITASSDVIELSNPGPDPMLSTITIHGKVVQAGVSLAPFTTVPITLPGVMDGPVEVLGVATDGITPHNLITVQRVVYNNAFNEIAGTPVSALTNKYFYSWYDSNISGGADWLLLVNPSSSTAIVNVTIAGTLRGQFTIPPHERVTPTFPGIVGGPVKVKATTTDNQTPLYIFTTERTLVDGMLEEIPGAPATSFTNQSNFSWYDSRTSSSDIVEVVNPDFVMIHAKVFLNGSLLGENDVPVGGDWTPSFAGQMGGPLYVTASVAGQPNTPANVFVTQRVLEPTAQGSQLNETLGW